MTTENHEYIDSLFSDLELALSENQLIKAEAILLEALQIEPDNAIAHSHLGWLYFYHLNKEASAEKHFRLAIKFDEDFHPSYQHLSALLVNQNRLTEARQLLKRGLMISGSNKAALYEELGRINELKGNVWLARRHYLKAIRQCMDNDYLEHLRQNVRRCRIKMFLLV